MAARQEDLMLIKATFVALGVFITSSLVVYTHIDFGFLSVITAFVLLQLFFSDLSEKAIERILGPALAATLILIVLIVSQNHYLTMLISSIILLMIFIYYFAIGFFSYSMILGALTISIITAMAIDKNLTEAVHLGLFWVINLLIGSIVVLLIDLVVSKWVFRKRRRIKAQNTPRSWIVPWLLFVSPWLFRGVSPRLVGYIAPWLVSRVARRTHHSRKKSKFNYTALIIAIRVTATFMMILLLNQRMNWTFIDIQAVIAGIIVAAQPSITQTHHQALMRMLGVTMGALIAIGFAYFLQLYPLPFFTVILITASLGTLTMLSETYPFYAYAFLQAGVMIPLILISSNQQLISAHLAVERSLGSLEGGLIGIAMVYLSTLFLRPKRR